MIKNIIYLDEPKMYSIYSQVFEGVTEYVLNENSSGKEESESQKAGIGSGRILADIINTENRSIEKRFLYDHAYSLLEKKLIEMKKVIKISKNSDSSLKDKISNYSFIRITANAIFNDANKIEELYSKLNEIGKAVTYITNHDEIQRLKKEVEREKSNTKDKTIKQKLDQDFKKVTDIDSLAKSSGIYQDPDFLKNLSFLTKYGFDNQLEVRQKLNDLEYSSSLKREYLREHEDYFIRKYSRKTEKEIILFGIVTQSSKITNNEKNSTNINQESPDDGMKKALLGLIDIIAEIEDKMFGKLDNEIIIDPLAVYMEL